MNPKINKVFKVSDGLANFTHKKVSILVKELQQEGVLTPQESKKVLAGVEKVKKALYDNVSAELKKILTKVGSKVPQKKKK